MTTINWRKIHNLLCIRLDNMGDVLMTTPAFHAIKVAHPHISLSLLTSSEGAKITKYIPDIHQAIIFSAAWTKQKGKKKLKETLPLLQEKFDAAIIFTNFSQSPLPAAMVCYLSNIPLVIAYCRENPHSLISHWIPDKEPFTYIRHGVERQLSLVKELGIPVMNDSLQLTEKKRDIFSLLEKTSQYIHFAKPFIIIHPGASEQKRIFSTKVLAQSANILLHDLHYQVIITGTKTEQPLGEYIQQYTQNKIINLIGKLSLGELISLIKRAKLFISNNTGPVHIASALQIPTLVLYAKTNPEHIPWKVQHSVLYFDVPEKQKSKNQLLQHIPFPHTRTISPQTIIEEAKKLLDISIEMPSLYV